MATKRLYLLEEAPLMSGETRLLTHYSKTDWEHEMCMINLLVERSNLRKVTSVEKVNNQYLYGMYLLHKLEMMVNSETVEERLLYHCTSPSNALQIAGENVNWRLTYRARFGQGACFSDSPHYADRYAGSRGAFVVCKVLTDKVQRLIDANYDLQIPQKGYDTTLGNNGQVCVKYDDFTFYPKYIVYYTDR